jgi:type II secretory pathway pseudopilin PulG
MLLTSSYGTRSENFEQLASSAKSLIDTLVSVFLYGYIRRDIDKQRSRPDTNQVLNAEYNAIVLILQAFQAYQQEEDAAQSVIPLATQVIHELRRLLLPPTRTPPGGSPNKKEAGPSAGTVKLPTKTGRLSGASRSVSTSGHPAAGTKGMFCIVTCADANSGCQATKI